ncbi:MAG TPA: DUF2306 domain-containing protein [Acidobacteriaceae bacterium]|nr:DUF2306 domain-containing protein [Acidobacteriaceae bacterium]
MSTATTPLASARGSKVSKYSFWTVMGLMGISVLIWTDLPLLHTPSPYRTKLIHDMFLLVPHAVAGVVATALGPFQFSTRFRQRHLSLHRLMGKIYVISICVAAPLALVLGVRGVTLPMQFMAWVQTVLWLGCTLIAFLTARNRHIQVHRQWMVRSYAFTLNFIFSRVLNPIPAYFNMSESAFALTLAFLTICYFAVPDVVFSWREMTHRRA